MKMPRETEMKLALVHLAEDRDGAVFMMQKGWQELREAQEALAVMTAERDRALAKLSDAEEDLGVELRKHETTLQAFGVVVKRLADAPHGPYCSSRTPVPEGPRYDCNCWKEGQ